MPSIILKNSNITSNKPVATDLRNGEIALNIADGLLFWKDSGGVVNELSLSGGGMPKNSIVAYNGLVADIPSGYVICNGANGTPDLTDKFIYGTITEGEIGDTGGSADAITVSHTHTGTSHTHTGTSHTHSGSSHTHTANHNHTATSNSTGAHSHTIGVRSNTSGGPAITDSGSAVNDYQNTGSAGAHAHTITVATKSLTTSAGGTGVTGVGGTGVTGVGGDGVTGSTGISGINENIPPYVKLLYIMKT